MNRNFMVVVRCVGLAALGVMLWVGGFGLMWRIAAATWAFCQGTLFGLWLARPPQHASHRGTIGDAKAPLRAAS